MSWFERYPSLMFICNLNNVVLILQRESLWVAGKPWPSILHRWQGFHFQIDGFTNPVWTFCTFNLSEVYSMWVETHTLNMQWQMQRKDYSRAVKTVTAVRTFQNWAASYFCTNEHFDSWNMNCKKCISSQHYHRVPYLCIFYEWSLFKDLLGNASEANYWWQRSCC